MAKVSEARINAVMRHLLGAPVEPKKRGPRNDLTGRKFGRWTAITWKTEVSPRKSTFLLALFL
jgi:hypothetical protein